MYQCGLQSYYHMVLGWYTMDSVWSGKRSVENKKMPDLLSIQLKYIPKSCFSLLPLTIDVQMVSMSYSKWYFPSVCSPEHSAFQVSFHDYSGLGPLFYFCYEIDLVSCWLLCYIHANFFSWSWSRGLFKQQNVHYGRRVVKDSLRVWSSYNVDFWEHHGQMVSVRQ